jgi:hypothetical protein
VLDRAHAAGVAAGLAARANGSPIEGPLHDYIRGSSVFADAVAPKRPLQVHGRHQRVSRDPAEKSGFKALYLSGGGVAAGSHRLPDLG